MDEIVIKEAIHFIGRECKKCGDRVRYVSNNKCVLCQSEYCLKWRDRNKKKVKEANKKYYEENKDVILEKQRQDYQKNKEKKKQYRRQYYKINRSKEREKQNIYKKGYYILNKKSLNEKRKVYYDDNRKRELETNKLWVQNNPEKVKAKDHRRRARELNAEGSFTDQEWIDLCNYHGNKCIVPGCENARLEADHIVPLSEGGTNYIWNIQPLCRSHNASKGAKTIDYRQTNTSYIILTNQ